MAWLFSLGWQHLPWRLYARLNITSQLTTTRRVSPSTGSLSNRTQMAASRRIPGSLTGRCWWVIPTVGKCGLLAWFWILRKIKLNSDAFLLSSPVSQKGLAAFGKRLVEGLFSRECDAKLPFSLQAQWPVECRRPVRKLSICGEAH